MALATQLAMNGIVTGSTYALVASGFSLIYSTNRFMHFAHGVSVAFSAYLLYTFFSLASIPFFVSCLMTLAFAGSFGWLINKAIYMPLKKKKTSNVILLIASISILMIVENILLLIFGASPKSISLAEASTTSITTTQLISFFVAISLFITLHLFMRKTKTGRDMRAVADNKELAEIIGINEKRITSLSFIIGSALAGVAGILISLQQTIKPSFGTDLIIRGFTGSIIGGITSVPGSIIGGFALGIFENLGLLFLPSGYKYAITFGFLFIFLLFRPQGIWGINKGIKK